MRRSLFTVLVVTAALTGFNTLSHDAEAGCNLQCRHRRDHCYNSGSLWRCHYWKDADDCYYCGGGDKCEKRNDAFAGPCASLIGTTNNYDVYDECTLICGLNPGGKAEGSCSGFVRDSGSTPKHACQGNPVADTGDVD